MSAAASLGGSSDPFDYNSPDDTVDQLQDDVAGPDAADINSLAKYKAQPVRKRQQTPASRLKDAQAAKAEQSNTLRDRFFQRATIGTGVVLALNFVVIGLYMRSQWGEISEAVMLAWISSTVVEVLGIVYIIARYLFVDAPTDSDGP